MVQRPETKRICEGDPIHRHGVAVLTPEERLARGFAWIEFTNRLRGIASREEVEWERPTPSAGAGSSSPSP